VFSLRRERAQVVALMQRYSSVPMSFTDACLVRMAELAPHMSVLTLNRDFTVYRRQGRRALDLVVPFR
jgi:uncharacterized protein